MASWIFCLEDQFSLNLQLFESFDDVITVQGFGPLLVPAVHGVAVEAKMDLSYKSLPNLQQSALHFTKF